MSERLYDRDGYLIPEPRTMSRVGGILGMRVVVSPFVPDGTFLLMNQDTIVVGTMPRTEIEDAGWHARWLVQQGLLDVLEWLGEKPIPERPMTGEDLLERLKQGG